MFSRLVEVNVALAAVFPFKRLHHSFMVGFGDTFDAEKERACVNVIRGWIRQMKKQVQRHVDPSDASAVRKAEHYFRMLDAQLVVCDSIEDAINRLMQPFPGRRMGNIRRDDEQLS